MNKSGSMRIYGLMLGVTIIILALALAPAGQEFIESAMNSSSTDHVGLDCNNSTISNFDKATCAVTDYSLFYFFGGLIFIGGAVVTARIMIG